MQYDPVQDPSLMNNAKYKETYTDRYKLLRYTPDNRQTQKKSNQKLPRLLVNTLRDIIMGT